MSMQMLRELRFSLRMLRGNTLDSDTLTFLENEEHNSFLVLFYSECSIDLIYEGTDEISSVADVSSFCG